MGRREEAEGDGPGCDCRRTRTTSRGVTLRVLVIELRDFCHEHGAVRLTKKRSKDAPDGGTHHLL